MHRAHVMTGGRYPVLRALGILYVIGAAAALCYGVYWVFWAMFAAPGGFGDRFPLAMQAMAATFFGVVTILAVAELIKLVIDIEHNTRVAAMNGASSAGNGDGMTSVATATGGHVNRVAAIDEESAEAALLRGH